MNVVYYTLVTIAVIIAIAFTLLVLVTGKGDAMSGGGAVRTTFKGKASFDDIMSRWTLWIGVAFMALVLIINIVAKRLDSAPLIDRSVNVTPPSSSTPATPPAMVPTATPTPSPSTVPPTGGVMDGTATSPTNTPGPSGMAPPVPNSPLDSTPATVPSANFPSGTSSTEPAVVPSVPGTAGDGTTTGGAANAAPPVGNR